MSVQQIPLVVSWIAAIDPSRETDQIGLADRMARELADASELGITEYYIGYFEQMPTFFMVGSRVEGRLPALPALPNGYYDYEIATLLVSPLIEQKLHLPLYHQVLQFIFKKGLVDRAIYQVEDKNERLRSALAALGFRDLQSADSAPNRIWYGCQRAEFLMRE
jgi:hypothetical protein